MIFDKTYSVDELKPYINWLYFFHAWDFPAKFGSMCFVAACLRCHNTWVNDFSPTEKARAQQALQLYNDACALLTEWDSLHLTTRFRVMLTEAYANHDDIVLPEEGIRLPMLRQQHVKPSEPCICLSDFIRPESQGIPDTIGLFLATAPEDFEQSHAEDNYLHLLSQTLADRLAEATAEIGHLETRRKWWGYAPDEQLSVHELLAEKFQGIRPAVGYPSLPDQSLIFLISKLLRFEELGVRTTESGSMIPHASISGLMISHPQSRYFAVGKIKEDQVLDYAKRRSMNPELMRSFLANSIL